MSSSSRQQRVADLIRKQLAQLLKKEIHDPRLSEVALTEVIVSPDLKHAKVYYHFSGTNPTAVKQAFAKASGYLRHLLAESIKLHHTPALQFFYDRGAEEGEKMQLLIDKALAEDAALHHKKNSDDSDE